MIETFDKIMQLPVGERFDKLLDRYGDLDEFTGCRSTSERYEMERIAQAVMPELIRRYRKHLTTHRGKGRWDRE